MKKLIKINTQEQVIYHVSKEKYTERNKIKAK